MKKTLFALAILTIGILLFNEYAFSHAPGPTILILLLVLGGITILNLRLFFWINKRYNLAKGGKPLLMMCILVVSFTSLGLLHKSYFSYQSGKLKMEGVELFTAVDSVTYEQRGRQLPDYYYYYRYNVDGNQYRYSQTNSGMEKGSGFKIGQIIKIKYLPKEPGNHEVVGSEN